MEEQFIFEGKIAGRGLQQTEVDSLSQEQLGQLYQLQQEAINPGSSKLSIDNNNNNNEPVDKS